jgi:hypothetical protein
MSTIAPQQTQHPADRFGRAVAGRLSEATAALPYDISERLRAARVQAVAQRKRVSEVHLAPVLVPAGGAAALGGSGFSLWNRIGSVLPLIVLAAGLVMIHSTLTDHRASELAEVDAALLTDDLPPAAYADPGFVQFMKSGWE